MKALILSGGRGTRLRPITHTSAKQLVPIANKPILFYALEAIAEAEIREVGIVVGETKQEIREAVCDGARWGLHVSYNEQESPLGLSHAVKIAETFSGSAIRHVSRDNLVEDGSVFCGRVRGFSQLADPLAVVTAVWGGGASERRWFPGGPQPSDLALVGVHVYNTIFGRSTPSNRR
jgi:dTDP-glucose pyrophosphorylase